MVLVKVSRITGMTDPVTGTPGRLIEFTEYSSVSFPGDESMRAFIAQLQSIFPVQSIRDLWPPKLVLFLRENEYLQLGLQLEVNDVYEVTFERGTITFRRATAER
ncbi:MAG: arcadin 1 [Nitrososphaeria archaeon]|jgi:hypothetical protein